MTDDDLAEKLGELDTLRYFISKLYDTWANCKDCQWDAETSTELCFRHGDAIEPLLVYEAGRRDDLEIAFGIMDE